MKRNRVFYILLIIFSILIGLGSRKFPEILPSFLSLYLGDTIWALMVFFMLGFIWTRKNSLYNGILTLVFSYMIEFSQLYHAAWIDNIRNTTLGSLVLGSGFLWSDLLCYTIGIILGMWIESYFHLLTLHETK